MSAIALTALFLVAGARSAFAQGTLVNGENHAGSISTPGEVDIWTFSAIQGAAISLRVGEVDPVSTAFVPWIRLRDPNGVLVGSNLNSLVGAIDTVAQLTGTYTVEIASGDVPNQGTGNYLLTLATGPGAFTVPLGDDGGPMTNGANHAGTIRRGDLDQWTFTAIQGAAISLRVGEVDPVSTEFVPWIRLRNPNGVQVASNLNSLVGAVDAVAQLTGTYTVVLASGDVPNQGTGNYLLTLATGPGAFTVPNGDEGGPMINGASHAGTIQRGDLDQWIFTAITGTPISLTTTEQAPASSDFVPWIRLRNPNGVQVASNLNSAGAVINYVPLLTGTYTVVVASGDVANQGTGNYTLLATGIQTPPSQPPLSTEKTQGGCNTCPCSMEGDPCDVATGNKFEQVTDYETAGPNVLAFTRSYNSFAGAASGTSLGRNWRHGFDRRLRINSPTSVSAERADGRVLAFTLTNGTWATDTDVDLKLTQTGSTWTLVDSGDTTETYTTASGGTAAILTAIAARNGYRQSLVHDTNGTLIRVTDSYNRTFDFTYTNSLLTTLTTPDGLVVTYSYGASIGGALDRLASASYGTATRTYLYEQSTFPFALTGIVDENGQRFTSWTYDSQGRALSSEHAGGVDRVEIAYNDTDGTRAVTHALGLQTVYHFTTLQGVPKVTQIDRLATATTAAATRTFTYDANGYLASATDWNGTRTSYVNDARGLPTTISEADGTAQVRTTTIAYDARFHLPVTITQPGLTAAFTYGADGNVLTRTETDTTTTTQPYATGGTSRVWSYAWTDGLLASVQGPRTDVTALTRFTYVGGALATITNALGQITQITTHTPGGRPLTFIDPNGVTTQFTYDDRQRLLSRTVNTADGALTTTNYTYDAAGNLLSITRPDGSVTTNSYDAAHRLTGMSDLLGERVAYTLDGLGNATLMRVLDANSTVTRTQSAMFDAIGRLSQMTGGAGQATQYSYDENGNVLNVNDPLGRPTQRAFDALNRPVRMTDPAAGVTTTSYDLWNRPLSVTAPNGAITTYAYDGFGNLIQTLSPDSGKTVYRYDLAGNLIRRDDAGGAVMQLTYDALDRVTAVRYARARGEDVAYRYDESGQGFGIGRLTSVDDAMGHLARTYDERGNVLAETRDVDRKTTLRTTYRYDAADRVVDLGYPSGAHAIYARDAVGRVSDITLTQPGAPARAVVTGVTYKPFGPLQSLTFGNGVIESRGFDLDYRLTTLAGTGLAPVQQLTYGYDASDNVLSILDGVAPGRSQTLGYDALDRLTGAIGLYGQFGWTYDAVGNRLTQQANANVSTYAYTTQSNRLIGIQDGAAQQQVSYTPAGNIAAFASITTGRQKKNTGTALAYNEAGRLSSILVDGRKIQSNGYDAFGQRLTRTGTTSGVSLFTYDLAGHLLEDADGRGNPRIDYIYLDDRPIATVTIPLSNTLAFLHDDRLGTPQLATDAAQTVVWKASYEPFGAATIEAGLVGQNLRFPGQEYDGDTGWHHNGFRDYAPGLGRYLQIDPIGLAGGLNTYEYSFGNTLSNIDPLGLVNWTQALIGTTRVVWGGFNIVGGSVAVLVGAGAEATIAGFPIGFSAEAFGLARIGSGAFNVRGGFRQLQEAGWRAPLWRAGAFETTSIPESVRCESYDYSGYSLPQLQSIYWDANDRIRRAEQKAQQAGQSLLPYSPDWLMRHAAEDEIRKRLEAYPSHTDWSR